MQKLKQRWEIKKNWQTIFPILGALLVVFTAYTISRSFLHFFGLNNTVFEWIFIIGGTVALYFILVKFFLWCFKKLENKWKVNFKWEMIAIFIVFAITGSLSGKLAGPLVHWMGIDGQNTNGAIYWILRILLIFPIYQNLFF